MLRSRRGRDPPQIRAHRAFTHSRIVTKLLAPVSSIRRFHLRVLRLARLSRLLQIFCSQTFRRTQISCRTQRFRRTQPSRRGQPSRHTQIYLLRFRTSRPLSRSTPSPLLRKALPRKDPKSRILSIGQHTSLAIEYILSRQIILSLRHLNLWRRKYMRHATRRSRALNTTGMMRT